MTGAGRPPAAASCTAARRLVEALASATRNSVSVLRTNAAGSKLGMPWRGVTQRSTRRSASGSIACCSVCREDATVYRRHHRRRGVGRDEVAVALDPGHGGLPDGVGLPLPVAGLHLRVVPAPHDLYRHAPPRQERRHCLRVDGVQRPQVPGQALGPVGFAPRRGEARDVRRRAVLVDEQAAEPLLQLRGQHGRRDLTHERPGELECPDDRHGPAVEADGVDQAQRLDPVRGAGRQDLRDAAAEVVPDHGHRSTCRAARAAARPGTRGRPGGRPRRRTSRSPACPPPGLGRRPPARGRRRH